MTTGSWGLCEAFGVPEDHLLAPGAAAKPRWWCTATCGGWWARIPQRQVIHPLAERHVVACHGDEGATVDTVAARCGMVPLGSHW